LKQIQGLTVIHFIFNSNILCYCLSNTYGRHISIDVIADIDSSRYLFDVVYDINISDLSFRI